MKIKLTSAKGAPSMKGLSFSIGDKLILYTKDI